MSDSDAYDRSEEHDRTGGYDSMGVDENSSERGKWVSVVVALLGLWMFVEPFLIKETVNFWNDMAIGFVLIILGAYNYYRRANDRLGSVSVGVLVALLGIWLIIGPFVLGETIQLVGMDDFGWWNDIIVGVIALILGAYSAYEARDTNIA